MKTCRKCNIELTDENWYPSLKKKNDTICKECDKKARSSCKSDSTALIHEIVNDHGSEDNRMLMVKLQNLRRKIILETHSEYSKRLRIIRDAIKEFPGNYCEEE